MTFRRALIFLSVPVLLTVMVTPAVAEETTTFADTTDMAQAESVTALAAEGVIAGCEDDRFCPRKDLSRGQVATMIVNGLGMPVPDDEGPSPWFSDTHGSAHKASIDAMAEARLVAGCGGGRYCPDEPITRGELATMLQRSFEIPQAPADVTYFSDADGAHENGISSMGAAGISAGCGLISYCAEEPLQRIHAAVFFARALELVERAELAPFEERKEQYDAEQAERQEEKVAQAAAAATGPGDIAVEVALAQLGKPYRWGATGPGSFDCSGLMLYAWNKAGVTLPRTSRAQFSGTTRISRSELQPGDMVYYHSPVSHVAMYIGDGRVVEAPYGGKNVRIRADGLTRRGIVGYGRP